MDPHNLPQTDADPSSLRIATGVGLLLVATGIAGVLWIGQQIIALGNDPQSIPLIAKFLAFDSTARTIVISNDKIVLPEGLYFAVGLFLFILVVFVAATLAKSLVSIGASLLGHNVASVLNRLREEIGSMKRHLESRNK